MTDLSHDLEELRGELRRAFDRDLKTRTATRRKTVLASALATAVLLASTGMALADGGMPTALTGSAEAVMAVFRSESADPEVTDKVRVQADDLNALSTANPQTTRPGVADAEAGRRLLAHEERGIAVEITAVPTNRGQACYWVRIERQGDGDRGGQFCAAELTRDNPIHTSGGHVPGAPSAVYGIASDEVVEILVRTEEGSRAATMGANAFFWSAHSPDEIPTELSITLRDGTVVDQHVGDAGPRAAAS